MEIYSREDIVSCFHLSKEMSLTDKLAEVGYRELPG